MDINLHKFVWVILLWIYLWCLVGLLIRYACISTLKHDEWLRHGDFGRPLQFKTHFHWLLKYLSLFSILRINKDNFLSSFYVISIPCYWIFKNFSWKTTALINVIHYLSKFNFEWQVSCFLSKKIMGNLNPEKKNFFARKKFRIIE